jgi:predicted alpha/beta-hydrolase family hydrolase
MSEPAKWIIDGPAKARRTLVLAHGAGAAMDSPFLQTVARGIADRGLRVVRFEFPYMQRRRESGRKSPPDRQPVLLECWRQVLRELKVGRPILAGKSLGGRMASLIADEVKAAGLVCLGYPFHPPGKPHNLRIAHLQQLQTPALIVQGERDPFGKPDEVAQYGLAETVRVEWLPDGDHSFKPRKASGRTEQQNLQAAVDLVAEFVKSLN